jgi:CRP-like cAMP-binding protein
VVREIILSIYAVSNYSIKMIEDYVTYVEFKKGHTFIQKNKPNASEYFLLDGICRSYLINPDGEEITISFFKACAVLSPFITRTSQGRSLLYFQTLTDVKLASIPALLFENFMIENIDIRNFGNTVLRNELMMKVEKEIGLASLTAKERLISFREQFPMFENLIPHPDIASYLGITNISLSRLRKELSC